MSAFRNYIEESYDEEMEPVYRSEKYRQLDATVEESLMFPFFHRLLRHFVTPLGIVSLGISGNDDCRVCFFPGLPPPSFEYLFYLILLSNS